MDRGKNYLQGFLIPSLACVFCLSIFTFLVAPLSFETTPLSIFLPKLTAKKLTFFACILLTTLGLVLIKLYKKKELLNFSNEDTDKICLQIVLGLLVGVSLIILSDLFDNPYSYSSRVRIGNIFFGLLIILLPLFFIKQKSLNFTILTCYFLLLFSFTFYTKGTALFTDDHATVIYRLHLLAENFPWIPFYNPQWNAGTDWRDFFATGILNVFFIFYLPIKLLGASDAYGLILPTLLFLVFPLSLYSSAKILSFSKTSGYIAAFLGICSSITFYKWSLSYGSLGFVCSLTIAPLAFTGLLKLIENSYRKVEIPVSLFLMTSITATLCFFWSMQVVAFLPILILTFVFCIKNILKNKNLRIIFLLVIVFNLSWAILFVKASQVSSFLNFDKISTSTVINSIQKMNLKKVPKYKLESAGEISKVNILRANPLIVAFFLPALFFTRMSKLMKTVCGINFLWLILIGILGPSFKPQLELDRLLLIFTVLSVLPTSGLFERAFTSTNPAILKNIANYLLCILIICFTSSISSTLQNRGWFAYTLLPKELGELSKVIETNAGTGRAMFSGFVLHELNGGHLAPLAQLTKVPLVASSPVHNLWWYTDVIPKEYRIQGSKGIEEYYDLMNVTLTIAHESRWKKYYLKSNEKYTKITDIGVFSVFERKAPSNYFVSGEGEIVEQTENEIKLKLKTPDALIKFHYYPFLEVKNCKKISENNSFQSLVLIKIEDCSVNNIITIRSVNPLKRMFH